MDVVDHLIEPPGAPVPPGARVGIITAADGVRLRWASFEATRPRGTVLLLQGRAEYIECYFETIRDLQARDFSVVAFDWRGQGGSQRLAKNPRKGHVGDMAAYDFDLDAILRLVAPDHPKPWYVLAHSTGGLAAVAARARLARDIRRMVLTAPFLGLGSVGPAEPIARALARTLRAFGLGQDWVPGGGATPIHTTPFEQNFLTSDPVRHALGAEMSWRHPELAIGSPTVGWLAAAFEVMDRVFAPEALTAWRLPTLIFACGDDRVVSNRAIEAFATRTAATEHLVIPGARHELLKERDRYREQFWAGFDAFVPGSDTLSPTRPKSVELAPAALPEPTAETPAPATTTGADPSTSTPGDGGTVAAAVAVVATAAAVATATRSSEPEERTALAPPLPEVIVLPPPTPEIAPAETPGPAAPGGTREPAPSEPEPESAVQVPEEPEPAVAAGAEELTSAPSESSAAEVPSPAADGPMPAVVESATVADEAITFADADAPSPFEPVGSPETDPAASPRAGEEPQDLFVQPAITAGDDTAAVDGAAAVPVGDDAAGALDHRDQRDDVVGLQPGLDDHVDEAAGDHAVGVAVDPVTRQTDP